MDKSGAAGSKSDAPRFVTNVTASTLEHAVFLISKAFLGGLSDNGFTSATSQIQRIKKQRLLNLTKR